MTNTQRLKLARLNLRAAHNLLYEWLTLASPEEYVAHWDSLEIADFLTSDASEMIQRALPDESISEKEES